MLLLKERDLQLIRDIPEEIKTLEVYGDQFRIQQVLADFLMNMVRHAPSPDGWVEIHVSPRLKQISDRLTLLHAKFRYIIGSTFLVISLFACYRDKIVSTPSFCFGYLWIFLVAHC